MNFSDIPNGTEVFVDANPFVYHFTSSQFTAACTELLERVERGEITGVTSWHVLAEVCHRLMTIEACTKFGWQFQGIAARLRRQPSHIQSLDVYRQSLREILKLSLRVLTIDEQVLTNTAAVSRQYGMLTNDAVIVALMQRDGLTALASHDTDFDRIPGITRYGPI